MTVYIKHWATIISLSFPVLLFNRYVISSLSVLSEKSNLSAGNSFSSFAVDKPVFLSVFNKNSSTKQNNLSVLYLLRQSIFSCFFVLFFNSSNCLYNLNNCSSICHHSP